MRLISLSVLYDRSSRVYWVIYENWLLFYVNLTDTYEVTWCEFLSNYITSVPGEKTNHGHCLTLSVGVMFY